MDGEIINVEISEDLNSAKSENSIKKSFTPEVSDFVFALAVFVMGYLFTRWVMFTWRGWGVALFTAVYLLTVCAYLIKKRAFVMKNTASWFWASVTLLTGLSYALWDGQGLEPVRMWFLFCAAVYFVLTSSGRTLMGKTGNYLLIDAINAVILIPFRNFFNQYIALIPHRDKKESTKNRLPVFLGILLAALLIVWLIPLLLQADSGGFSKIVDLAAGIITPQKAQLIEFFVYAALSVPVSAYIFGLISGAAHKKGTDTIKPDGAQKAVEILRIIQPVTIYIALGALCALYTVFILCQIPYFFSSLGGNMPDGFLSYSEFARKGFFELCGITALNLAFITAGNVTCAKPRFSVRTLKAFNVAIALITILLIVTAFSKMALYIGTFGLSMPRLLPCVFMLFLAAVFFALIAMQKHDFSIVRFALVTGAVMLCVLFALNPDSIVVRYNTDRYLSGTLSDYDTEILYRAGQAGVLPALEVYERTQNGRLKTELERYLYAMKESGGFYVNTHRLSYERYRALSELRNSLGDILTEKTEG